ncbi:HigA family addiction module antitoxin [Mucilaginibacter sp. BT774]|uniref:HigA family addiction module antitoxin n=1 Tax=Mucilaginibacter sp. BT774 TaxID=3062276 RepID=UPI0026761FAB|nr:HigA family addiction module antitoxin [Mucilaginibacter sp. BT774]MDO3626274.1 HigA family addiction module antitoxin [Mucilaginibacter sp. BT774]
MQNVHEVVDRDGKALRSPDLFHPGYILKEEIEAREITKKDFAVLLNILPTHLSEVFAGRRPVGPKMARRLERALEISAGFWLRMQSDYDLKVAEQEPDPVLEKIEDILAIQQRSNTSLAKALVAYEVGHASGGWAVRSDTQTVRTATKSAAVSRAAAKSGKFTTVKEKNAKKTR